MSIRPMPVEQEIHNVFASTLTWDKIHLFSTNLDKDTSPEPESISRLSNT